MKYLTFSVSAHGSYFGTGNRHHAGGHRSSQSRADRRSDFSAGFPGETSEEAEKVYRPVREFAVQRGWKLKPQQANGNTVDAIIAFVETKKQDLIVMRTHGHSSLLNVALRSVTTGELSRCEVSMPLLR